MGLRLFLFLFGCTHISVGGGGISGGRPSFVVSHFWGYRGICATVIRPTLFPFPWLLLGAPCGCIFYGHRFVVQGDGDLLRCCVAAESLKPWLKFGVVYCDVRCLLGGFFFGSDFPINYLEFGKIQSSVFAEFVGIFLIFDKFCFGEHVLSSYGFPFGSSGGWVDISLIHSFPGFFVDISIPSGFEKSILGENSFTKHSRVSECHHSFLGHLACMEFQFNGFPGAFPVALPLPQSTSPFDVRDFDIAALVSHMLSGDLFNDWPRPLHLRELVVSIKVWVGDFVY